MPPKDATKDITSLAKLLRGLSVRRPTRNSKTNITQTSLIFCLPNETFVEILSHFATFKLHELYYHVDQLREVLVQTRHLPRTCVPRHWMLLTLTQVCRDMREKFLPWYLEHVQSLCIYTGSESDGAQRERRRVARKSLLRQMKVLVASPPLAAHVRTMTVHLHRQTIYTIAECLALLPNLHTLEITTSDHSSTTIESAFWSVRLPRVRTLVVDPDAHHIIWCCQNVEHVLMYRYSRRPIPYVRSIVHVKRSITRVGLCAFRPLIVEELARLFPELQELCLVQPFDAIGSLDCLPSFKRLHLLELVLDPGNRWTWRSWREHTDPIVGITHHAIMVLKRIHGHTKVFKMITIGKNSCWEDIQGGETEVIEVP